MATKKYIYDDREWSVEEIKQLLKPEKKIPSRAKACLQMVEGDVVLDVGCGVGAFAYYVASRASKVVAIDSLETSIEIARDFFSLPNIDFIAGDLFQLKFPGSSFDCVLFLETIEHVENPAAFLKEFYRLLKPGGLLIISTPNALSYPNIVRNAFLYFSRIARAELKKSTRKSLRQEHKVTTYILGILTHFTGCYVGVNLPMSTILLLVFGLYPQIF